MWEIKNSDKKVVEYSEDLKFYHPKRIVKLMLSNDYTIWLDKKKLTKAAAIELGV